MTRNPVSRPRKRSSGSTTRRNSPSRVRASSRRPRATTRSTDRRPGRPVFVAIGLGANLGDPVSTVRQAARALAAFVTTPRLSPLYRTSPVGGPPQPPFVNAVLTGRTRLAPEELLARLQRLERAAGRRPGPRNGPRPLDLDLLLYDGAVRDAPAPVLPHPRIASRLFVLVPLADVAPTRIVPGTGKTVARLLSEARRRWGGSVRPLRNPRGASGSRASAALPRG